MPRKDKFPEIMQMIQAYEYKFKRQMMYGSLIDYIQFSYKFARKTAEEYGQDLRGMNYIIVEANGRIVRNQ